MTSLKRPDVCVFPESSACSPLSWLLSEYLDNSEAPRRCKSRATIFNSRVRRLTHLLVHVDTSRVDGEELKPPVKSSESEHVCGFYCDSFLVFFLSGLSDPGIKVH